MKSETGVDGKINVRVERWVKLLEEILIREGPFLKLIYYPTQLK